MKIIIFTALYPPCIGGLSSHADEFNRHIVDKNTKITIFTCLLTKDSSEREQISEQLNIIRFPAFEIVPNYPIPKFWKIRFWKLFLALFQEDYDLVLSRIRFFNTSILAMLFAKIKKVRWIHIEHTSNFTILSSPLKSFVAKYYDLTIGRLVFQSSDMNVSISQAVQKFILKFDKRFSPVIYRGLNLKEIDEINPDHDLRSKFPDKLILLTASRLYKWKGVAYSIQAIKKLPKKIKDRLVFVIIGDGEDFSHLKKICDESIVMLGSLPRNKVIGIMKVTDIYIHSSMHGGGLSTSLLEAMYCNCAIIATPHEGADEVVNEKNGLLLKTLCEKEIRQALCKLISKRELANSFAQQARKDIAKKFCWKNSIDSYKKILVKSKV